MPFDSPNADFSFLVAVLEALRHPEVLYNPTLTYFPALLSLATFSPAVTWHGC